MIYLDNKLSPKPQCRVILQERSTPAPTNPQLQELTVDETGNTETF